MVNLPVDFTGHSMPSPTDKTGVTSLARAAGWDHGRVSRAATTLRFRHSSAITVGAVIAMIAGSSLATWAPYLLVLLLVPLAVAVWSWRAGTDVDADAVTIRAAVGRRRVPWSQISELAAQDGQRVTVRLTSGSTFVLPAVGVDDMPRLVAATGKSVTNE
jgi:hypothetical protein